MEEQPWQEPAQAGAQFMDRAKQMVREGNARRVIVKRGGERMFDLPLTVGVAAAGLGLLKARRLTMLGLLAAMLGGISLEVEPRGPEMG